MRNDQAINWLRLLGENGWQWSSEKSYDDDYSFYEARILGSGYDVGCWARVSDGYKGYKACGDYGVAWIECDVSTYTTADYLDWNDAQEIMYAIDHAESNLLQCGIPFTAAYRFHGKNTSNKVRRNAALRRKLGLKTKEEGGDGNGCVDTD